MRCKCKRTAVSLFTGVSFTMDFSNNEGLLPTTFGTDEIVDNTEGYEPGWMINGWEYSKKMFNLYRIQAGDSWPRGYGTDRIIVGRLADGISATSSTIRLTDLKCFKVLAAAAALQFPG